jgi:acylphosphatase
MAEITHETVYFSGRVQGVGFRFNVLQIAKEYDVAGFVRNCIDGRVELQVEAMPGTIREFVEMIGERMHGFVRTVERSAVQRQPEFRGFEIR